MKLPEKTILWILGEPAVGKTSVVRMLFDGKTKIVAKPKWTLSGSAPMLVVAAGHYTGKDFDGADTVPYNGAWDALEYWFRDILPGAELTIFDGDRFSNATTLEFCKDAVEACQMIGGLRLCCVLLTGDAEAVAARRKARSNQDETWARGRKTKAANFAARFTDRLTIHEKTPEEAFRLIIEFLEGPRRRESVPAQQGSLL